MTSASLNVTVVIVNWNGGELLMRCLASIRKHAAGRGVSVIVVDNDSRDGSREAAARGFPEFKVINSGGNLGFGRANNLARTMVTTPLVLFLNPDTELLEGSLEKSVQCLHDHSDVGVVGCRMLEPDGTVQELGLQWSVTPWTALLELLVVTTSSRRRLHRFLPVVDPLRSAYVRKLYGGFLLVRREVLDAAGWFDERYFMYAEDADLSRTIPTLGWKLFYCADAVIVHVGGGVTTGAPGTFSTLMMQESVNKMIAKYQGRTAALLHRIAILTGGLLRLGAVLIVGMTRFGWRPRGSAASWRASRLKQQQLVLWSLGLRRAAVPVARSRHAD
jgi:GT2 family glycosyltransferase